jgi:hypothetical protein
MALELNKLDEAQILKFKTNSDIAAKKLNADVNREKLLKSVSELFGKQGWISLFPSRDYKHKISRESDSGAEIDCYYH